MALPPSLWPSRLLDQNFGMCITPNDFLVPFYNSYNYYRPWKWNTPNLINDIGSTINNEEQSFKVTLDVQHFRPNELCVKVANNQIIVEGKHEERKDEHGFVSRQFTRRYAMPSICMPEDVVSNLSSDGVLTVIANKKIANLTKNEKSVAIKLCQSCPLKDKAATKVSEDKSAEVKADEADRKSKQIMLKEDHCCLLLKPELLQAAASESSELTVEKTKENVQEMKTKQAGKNTSEMLEKTFAKSIASVSDEKCEKIATSKTEKSAQQKIADSLATSSDKCKKTKSTKTKEKEEQKKSESALAASTDKREITTTSKTEQVTEQIIAGSMATLTASSEKCGKTTSDEHAEQKTAASIETMSSTATEKCDITTTSKSEESAEHSTTMVESEEKFDLFDEATACMTTSQMLEQNFEKSNIAISSLSEIVGQSSMSKSEISGVSSMSSKTSESIECAASSPMASNIIKEMNEELTDFVTEMLCFEEELEKSLDIKK